MPNILASYKVSNMPRVLLKSGYMVTEYMDELTVSDQYPLDNITNGVLPLQTDNEKVKYPAHLKDIDIDLYAPYQGNLTKLVVSITGSFYNKQFTTTYYYTLSYIGSYATQCKNIKYKDKDYYLAFAIGTVRSSDGSSATSLRDNYNIEAPSNIWLQDKAVGSVTGTITIET